MRRKNSYDFIRFVAASMVVFSHSYALTGHWSPGIGGASLGHLGVLIFFIMSGYLIAASWDQYPRFNVFMAKRMLRIFPGLIMAVFLTVIVCGLFFSSLSLVAYFTNPRTYTYLGDIFLVKLQYDLPGVFAHNPLANNVNGSLWTLTYEFLMYIAVGLLGAFQIYKRVSIVKIWVGLFVLQLAMSIIGAGHFQFFVGFLQPYRLVPLTLMFFTGVLVHKKAAQLPKLVPKYGVVTLAAFLVFSALLPRYYELAAATLLAYALFSLGSSPRMSWFGKYGDFSYGIYIYSFVIQQMLWSALHLHNPWVMFALAWPISILAGASSWWLVESRFLKYKNRINLKKYPLPETEVTW